MTGAITWGQWSHIWHYINMYAILLNKNLKSAMLRVYFEWDGYAPRLVMLYLVQLFLLVASTITLKHMNSYTHKKVRSISFFIFLIVLVIFFKKEKLQIKYGEENINL